MNKLLLILVAFLLGNNLFAQSQNFFNTEVETSIKPWTNLEFYNNPDNFQFAIISDRNGGHRPLIFEDAVEKLNIMYPEFVLSVGDLINGYTKDTAQIKFEWDEVNQIIDDLKMPFFYLPGNHDITNQIMAVEWEKRYGRRYYSFTYKNTLFVILDSNDDEEYNLTQEQTNFVLETLKKNSDVKWTFVLMHHPIWTYNTGGRFEAIEAGLKGRKYTVIAGHTHNYNHEVKHGQNYYVLATTGAGSRLRGNYFGEFDHITWVTMTDAGPSLANLRLDGILPHDVTNRETKSLAHALAANAVFEHVLLCNDGDRFTDGTLYFHFKNNGAEPMKINLQFYHQHQLLVPKPVMKISLDSGEEKVVEIPFSSQKPLTYDEIENLQINWMMGYDLPEFPDFHLKGLYTLEVKPTETTFLHPQIPKFLNDLTVSATNPYNKLNVLFDFNGQAIAGAKLIEGNTIQIDQSGNIGMKLRNNSGQGTAEETMAYEKVTKLNKSKNVKNPKEGLKYEYFEGEWGFMPDFSKLEAKSNGYVKDFWVGDYALREDNFAMILSGYILVPEDGMYTFSSRSDDACRLIIHDELVVSQGKVYEEKEIGAIALKKGYHPVTIQFLEGIGRERLRIYIKKMYDERWKELHVKETFFY